MSEQVAHVFGAVVIGPSQTSVTRQATTHYEVWHEKTMVLRTVHETQAVRYAHEVHGEVRTVTSNGVGS
jgi:hypothetical protein